MAYGSNGELRWGEEGGSAVVDGWSSRVGEIHGSVPRSSWVRAWQVIFSGVGDLSISAQRRASLAGELQAFGTACRSEIGWGHVYISLDWAVNRADGGRAAAVGVDGRRQAAAYVGIIIAKGIVVWVWCQQDSAAWYPPPLHPVKLLHPPGRRFCSHGWHTSSASLERCAAVPAV